MLIIKGPKEVINFDPTQHITNLELHVHSIESIAFPPSLTHLTFGSDFNLPVFAVGSLAADHLENITFLKFAARFNQPVLQLPPRLAHLIFGSDFDQHLPYLPSSLRSLKFGYCFNRLVSDLPSLDKLTHLSFNFQFNQPIFLPKNLTHLSLGYCFNQQITFLPHTLLQIILGYHFNYQLPNLPPNLEVILFSPLHEYEYVLPPTITKLRIPSKIPINYSLPKKITHLRFELRSLPSTTLPTTITHFSAVALATDVSLIKLPHSVTHLQLAANNHFLCPILPPNLIFLIIQNGDLVNQTLPRSLVYFKYYSTQIPHVPELPPQITHLSLFYPGGYNFEALPAFITHLYIHCYDSTSIPPLQSSITHLTLTGVTSYLKPNFLPPSLVSLVIPSSLVTILPDTLEYFVTLGTARLRKFPKSLKYIMCKGFEKVIDEPPPTVRIVTHNQDLFPFPDMKVFFAWKFPFD